MKRIVGWSMVIALAACAQGPFLGSDESDIGATRRYLVVFRSETMPADAATRMTRAGGAMTRSLGQVGIALAVGNEQFAGKLAKDPTVLAVGPEHFFLSETSS